MASSPMGRLIQITAPALFADDSVMPCSGCQFSGTCMEAGTHGILVMSLSGQRRVVLIMPHRHCPSGPPGLQTYVSKPRISQKLSQAKGKEPVYILSEALAIVACPIWGPA